MWESLCKAEVIDNNIFTCKICINIDAKVQGQIIQPNVYVLLQTRTQFSNFL